MHGLTGGSWKRNVLAKDRKKNKPAGNHWGQWLPDLPPEHVTAPAPDPPTLILSCLPGFLAEAGSVVVPTGAGLVASSPPDPMQVMRFGQKPAGDQHEQ